MAKLAQSNTNLEMGMNVLAGAVFKKQRQISAQI